MGDEAKSCSKSHILMLPWLAIGHITPYLHLANRLAERGYKISFLVPNKAKLIVQPLNLHPHLITFHPLSIPHVDGLPPGAETTNDISGYRHLTPLIVVALDLTRPQVEQAMLDLKPDFAFYDTAHWVPDVATQLGIKSVAYHIVSAASLAIAMVPACSENYCIGGDQLRPPRLMTPKELRVPPPGYPSDTVVMRKHEADKLKQFICQEHGRGNTLGWRINASLKSGDAIAIRTTRETEGQFCDYLSSLFDKPVLLTGPVLPDSTAADSAVLEERWASWLGGHEPGSVVYCALGSEVVLEKEQFKEAMDEGSEVGKLIRENHAKWREALGGHASPLAAYIDSFVQKLSEI